MVGFAALLQYIQSKLSLSGAQHKAQLITMLLGPVLTFVILWTLPSAVGLYWAATSGFSIVQQTIINKQLRNYHGGVQSNNSKTG